MVASLAGPVPGGHDPDGQAALIDVLTALERVKGAAAAAQADLQSQHTYMGVAHALRHPDASRRSSADGATSALLCDGEA